MHRKDCLPSVQLDQDDALFYEQTGQKPIRLYGEHDKKGTIPVYKAPGEDTYYFKISKLFYESITQGGRIRWATYDIGFKGNLDNSGNFFMIFLFDKQPCSLSFCISLPTSQLDKSVKECRRMALPIIFNGKGEKLLNKSFVLTLKDDSSCGNCGCKVTKDTFTHPNPYPICLQSYLNKQFDSKDGVLHNDDFPECIYVQIKLTPGER